MLEMMTLVDAADDPYTLGRVARAKGESADSCPYDLNDPSQDDDRMDWFEGFNDNEVWKLEDDE